MKPLFWSIAILLYGLFQGNAYADESLNVEENAVVQRHWKVHRVEVRGGDFWTGYTKQVADLLRCRLDGTWDRRKPNESIVTFRKTRGLETAEQRQIMQHLFGLEKSATAAAECGIIADGPEEFLILNFRDEANMERKLRVVAEDRRLFVCGDRYVTPASLAKLVRYIDALLPAPPPNP